MHLLLSYVLRQYKVMIKVNNYFYTKCGLFLMVSLCTANATIKVHLVAIGALCFDILLAHKRVLVNYVSERLFGAISTVFM